MHRLLGMRRQTLFLSQFFDCDRKCLQCHMRHFSIISTLPNIGSNANTTRKKRVRGNNKYAEILVVGDKSSVEEKTIKVRALRPDELGRLALSNLDLSELYKLKLIDSKGKENSGTEHTYNNLTDVDNLPTSKDQEMYSEFITEFFTTTSGPIVKYHFYHPPKRKEPTQIVSDRHAIDTKNLIQTEALDSMTEETEENDLLAADLEDLESIDDTIEIAATRPSKSVRVAVTTMPARPDLRKIAVNAKIKGEVAAQTLASYIDVCNSLKYSLRGLQALQFHRRKSIKGNTHYPTLTGNIAGVASVYIGLLRGFAARADLPHMKEVIGCAEEDGVPLPLDGHVAVLECLGRLVTNKSEGVLEEIKNETKALYDAEFTFDDIINKGIFLNDQRTFVLVAIRQFDPQYVPKFALPTVHYENKLVNSLNHSDQLTDPFVVSKPQSNNALLNGSCSQAKLQAVITAQLEIEQNVYVKVRSIENDNDDDSISFEVQQYRRTIERQRKLWQDAAQAALARDRGALTARGVGGPPHFLESYMRSVPAKDLVEILITEAEKVAQGSETYSPTTTQLYKELGMKVWARYRVLKRLRTGVQDSVVTVHREYCSRYYAPRYDVARQHKPSEADRKCATINQRQAWQWLLWRSKQQMDVSTEIEGREWPSTTIQSVGRFLYHIVMYDLKVDVNALSQAGSIEKSSGSSSNYLPAFYTVFRTQGSSGGYSQVIKEEVKPHPVLSRLYRASRPTHLSFPAYDLPMFCPPIPWLGVGVADTNSTPPGGYLIQPTDLMRLPTYAQTQKELLEKMERRQLYPTLDALNHLSAVPWQVNEPVLDVILQVFKKGGDTQLNVPESPTMTALTLSRNSENSASVGTMSLRQKLQLRRKKAELYSLWCDCLYRLSLANHYRGHTFWLPHNLDFRGRTYPVAPHLSHLGSDLARSILVFAEARPLGPHGLDWLKLHLANLTGAKKRDPLEERLRWVNEKMTDVVDSAERPLFGNKWWLKADEPWQALACCMEIVRIVNEIERGRKVDEIESRFPVHQDGSCNGLQHYAALGRDKQGAYSVNLCANVTTPQDVYSSVATLIEAKRQQDSEQGLLVAKVLDGFVKRKVIKQTVMTTVYGVTRFGARLQIVRQLRDLRNETNEPQFPREHIWTASNYLTARTFESLKSMFNSAREIQDWFTDCARLISSVCGKHVEWRTPLGLPVVQPYCRPRQITNNSVQTYMPFMIDKHERPNVMKQKNAFPPNFIHSLDSSHMMLTALWAERAPITFVSVHDCFWTHPSTVNIMNRLCREQFVALHSEPILDDLSSYLSDLYSYRECELLDDGSVTDLTKRKLNRILSKLPSTGTFDINEVLHSTYFFS